MFFMFKANLLNICIDLHHSHYLDLPESSSSPSARFCSLFAADIPCNTSAEVSDLSPVIPLAVTGPLHSFLQ